MQQLGFFGVCMHAAAGFLQAPTGTARRSAACPLQDDAEFQSAKSVLAEMGGEIAKSLELASFHTVSKGALGECGLRGGYVELTNMHPKTVEELYKVASINLAPNSYGQVSAVNLTLVIAKQKNHLKSFIMS